MVLPRRVKDAFRRIARASSDRLTEGLPVGRDGVVEIYKCSYMHLPLCESTHYRPLILVSCRFHCRLQIPWAIAMVSGGARRSENLFAEYQYHLLHLIHRLTNSQ